METSSNAYCKVLNAWPGHVHFNVRSVVVSTLTCGSGVRGLLSDPVGLQFSFSLFLQPNNYKLNESAGSVRISGFKNITLT